MLKRSVLSRLRDLEPVEAGRRYEHANPGDMTHLDISKLGRFTHAPATAPASEQASLQCDLLAGQTFCTQQDYPAASDNERGALCRRT